MKAEYPPLYPYSLEQAKQTGEQELWKQSRAGNVSCAQEIGKLIDARARDGQLEPGCARDALDRWGFPRVQFVLANTLIGTGGLGFEMGSLRWARSVFVPPDYRNDAFRIQMDRSLLAQFLRQTYGEYQAQGMFGPEHCAEGQQDYAGKVLVLRPTVLKEDCWRGQNQLWYAECGFGLSPYSRGKAVFATCLGDGEKARWERSDFLGVLDEQYLPDWAVEKLAELRGPQQEQQDGPAQGGMEMR